MAPPTAQVTANRVVVGVALKDIMVLRHQHVAAGQEDTLDGSIRPS